MMIAFAWFERVHHTLSAWQYKLSIMLLLGTAAGCGGIAAHTPTTSIVVNDPLPVASLDADIAGIDRRHWNAALMLIATELPKVDSIVVMKTGAILAEAHYNGYSGDHLHDMRSTTKSITSLLVGAAIDRGAISSVDATVASFFPEIMANPTWKRVRAITLRDLLTMRSGLDCDDWGKSSFGNEERLYRTRDWIAFFFSIPNADTPGERFSYCTAGVIILGEIVARAAGKSLPAFAREALFEPLGIRDAIWQTAPKGLTDAGGHLQLSAHSLAKIGLLVHQRGVWQSKRVVSDTWITEMLMPHTKVNNAMAPNAQYGYLWWLEPVSNGLVRSYQSRGNGGQTVIVVPECDLIVAFTGRAFNELNALAPFMLTTRFFIPMAKGLPYMVTGSQ
jgi:CubicO group peptidase (beta-lactamase class C family)